MGLGQNLFQFLNDQFDIAANHGSTRFANFLLLLTYFDFGD